MESAITYVVLSTRDTYAATGGFRGSPYMTSDNPATSPGHVPSTYTALACLALLEAPLDRLDRPGLLKFLRQCQAADGSFAPVPGTQGNYQNDARMSYAASVVRAVALQGTRSTEDIDVERAKAFINSCRVGWELNDLTTDMGGGIFVSTGH